MLTSRYDDDSIRSSLDSVFTYSEARSAGVTDRRLYAWRDDGTLLALGGGIYRWADAEPANLDLIEIAERMPRATLCLDTALVHHDLIDVIPPETDVAIPRGSHRARLTAPTRLHQFDRDTFDIGRDELEVGARRRLGIYTAERSIIDIVRLRHDQGTDLAWEALRRWLRRPGRNPGQLVAMAARFKGAEIPIRRALEVLL